jgi:uncharacterized membrane protein
MAGLAYWLLSRAIIQADGPDSLLAKAIGRDWKGNVSVALYLLAIPLTFLHEWIAEAIYVGVALLWLIPDRRIERALQETGSG